MLHSLTYAPSVREGIVSRFVVEPAKFVLARLNRRYDRIKSKGHHGLV